MILLKDGEGAIVTIELKTGETLRGFLFEAEDTMNMVLKKVTKTTPLGHTSKHDSIYVRGASVMFVVLPAILKNAPMFKRIAHWREKGGAPPNSLTAAGGQAQAILRKAQERSGAGRGGPPRGMPRGPPPGGGFQGGGFQGGGPPMGGFQPRGMPPPPPGGGYGGGGHYGR